MLTTSRRIPAYRARSRPAMWVKDRSRFRLQLKDCRISNAQNYQLVEFAHAVFGRVIENFTKLIVVSTKIVRD